LIEYNGDYWHCNPIKYKDGQIINYMNKGKIMVNEIWARDKVKKDIALNNSYKLEYIWEYDYKNENNFLKNFLIKIKTCK